MAFPLAIGSMGRCSSPCSRRWRTSTRHARISNVVLDSTQEGGQVLIRLDDQESLGRELRAYLKTDKYLRTKNDGTLPAVHQTYPP